MRKLKSLFFYLLLPCVCYAEVDYIIPITIYSFGGSGGWTRAEWKQIVSEVQRRQREELKVRTEILEWYHKRENRCRAYYKFDSYKTYGNCILRRHIRPNQEYKVSRLALAPPIPSKKKSEITYVTGLSTGVCHPGKPFIGTAMIAGKRVSTYISKAGLNLGLEMSITTINHESAHLFGAEHLDDGGVMDSDALYFIVSEWPDAVPYPKFSQKSKSQVHACLGINGFKL